MKKIQLKVMLFICSFMILDVSTSFAAEPEKEPCPVEVQLKDQFYVAVSIGYDSYKLIDNVNYYDADHEILVSNDPKLNLPGMIGELLLGYGRYLPKFKRMYLGIEGFAIGSAADTTEQLKNSANPITIDTDIIVKGGYGASFIPGFKINRISMLYGKFGYTWTMIEIEETTRNDGFTSVEYNKSITTGGFTYGAGIESAFNQNFSLRVELNHTVYEEFTTEIQSEIKPSDTQFILALVYHLK